MVRVEFDGDPIELDLSGLSEEQATQVKDFTESAYRVYNRKMQETEQVIGMACLLYTSPSPRDRTRSRMPSSA